MRSGMRDRREIGKVRRLTLEAGKTPSEAAGEVQVKFDHSAPDRLRLEVCDHGVGLPTGFDIRQSNASLGMRLISTFTRQLDGNLTVASAEPGTRFILDMPARGDTARRMRDPA